MTVTLEQVVTNSGIDFFASSVAGMDRHVREVVLYDPLDGVLTGRDAIYLAVGCDPTSRDQVQMLRRLADGGAVAIVYMSTTPLPANLCSAAAARHVAVLAVSPRIRWDDLHARLRHALRVQEPGPVHERGANVSHVVDWAADRLNSPVFLVGKQLELIAYSAGEFDAQSVRSRTILRKGLAKPWSAEQLRQLRDGGVVTTQDGPWTQFVAAASTESGVLGYLVVEEGAESRSNGWQEKLAETAGSLAAYLLRRGSDFSAPWLRRAQIMRALLDKESTSERRLEELELPPSARRYAIMTVDAIVDDALRLFPPGLLSAQLALLTARDEWVVVLQEGSRISALIAADDEDQLGARILAINARLTAFVADFLNSEVMVFIGRSVGDVDQLADSFRDTEVLRQRCDGSPTVLRADDNWARIVLAELHEFMAANVPFQHGPAKRLGDVDAARGTEYVSTVRAFIDSLGSIPAAAEKLGVHPNTVRYRLRKLQDEIGLDLDDADERLGLDIELRLRHPSPMVGPTA